MLLESEVKPKLIKAKEMTEGRDSLITQLEQLFEIFGSSILVDANFHEFLLEIIKNDKAINYRVRAAKVLGLKVVAPLIKQKKYRQSLTDFTDQLRSSKGFRDRQLYVVIAQSTYEGEPEIFKKHFAKNILGDLLNEKNHTVKISLAKLCDKIKLGFSKSLDKVRDKLVADKDPQILQFMGSSIALGIQAENQRRYLKFNYGEDSMGIQEGKHLTEE